MNKSIATLVGLLSLAYMTPVLAQNFESLGSSNMVTRQTIHSDASGSTTITTVIEPSQTQMPAKAAHIHAPTQATTTTNTTAPTNLMPAPASQLPVAHEVVSHYHFGSQATAKSTDAYQAPTPQIIRTPKPTVRYENVREDPEDVMMRILNQGQ